jgi:tryptophan-rich sensory protein
VWYNTLQKPSWNPPSWIFGPVWTTLYALMGIAAFLIWSASVRGIDGRVKSGWRRKDVRAALTVFGVQLMLNAIWSVIFFGLHSPMWAFVEIVFLWISIVATMVVFAKISKLAVWLLVPYILWVSFAGFLNYTLWQLNQGIDGQTACPAVVETCSDGSLVGPVGPLCEFAACPTPVVEIPLKTFTDAKRGISFKYPEQLAATYIRLVDWPPQVDVVDEPFVCIAAGTEMARAGRTEEQTINGHTYCVTKESQGAAGSIYTNYAYEVPRSNGMVIFTFSVQAVQCANYDEPKKTECEQERTAFNFDKEVDRMITGATIR